MEENASGLRGNWPGVRWVERLEEAPFRRFHHQKWAWQRQDYEQGRTALHTR